MTENSYEVIILYLLEIDYYWQIFLDQLANNCNPKLLFHITKLSLDKKKSYNLYLETLSSIKGIINLSLIENNFRKKLVYSKIFSEISYNSIDNLSELYKILIEVEYRTITFIEEYFNKLPYLKMQELLSTIICEKLNKIEKLKQSEA